MKSNKSDSLDARLACGGLLGIVFAVAFVACGNDVSTTSGSGGSSSDGGSGGESSTSSSSGGSGAVGSCEAADTDEHVAEVVEATNAFLATLTTAQQTTIAYDMALDDALVWSNLPAGGVPRNGVAFEDMSAAAQTAAVALIEVAAGSTGGELFDEVRTADDILVSQGNASSNGYNSGLYYVAVLGTPSTSESFMLQFGGHHIAYNFTYGGPCISASPMFDGVEPTSWTDTDGSHAPLETQRASMAALATALSAVDGGQLDGTFNDLLNGPVGGGGPNGGNGNSGDTNYPNGLTYPTGTTGRGVLASTLSEDDQELVKVAIEAWVDNVATPVADALLEAYESEEAFAETYVGYSGSADLSTQSSYVRIDGPRVWIEFSAQGGVIYQNQIHFHTLYRDKVADYGAEFISE